MVYNGYYKVMSNIPKMGHLTTPVVISPCLSCLVGTVVVYSRCRCYSQTMSKTPGDDLCWFGMTRHDEATLWELCDRM